MINPKHKACRRTCRLAAAMAAALSCAPGIAAGYEAHGAPSDRAFAQLELIDEGDLDLLRGGLTIGGIEMEFGATLRTLVDNIKLTTAYGISEAGIKVLSETLGNVSVEDGLQNGGAGAVTPISRFGGISIPVSVTRSQAPTSAAPPASAAGQAASSAPTVNSSGINATLVGPTAGARVTDLTPAGVALDGVANYRGIVVNDAKGFTAALHDITREAIISSLVSTASNRKISQRLELDVRLQNIAELRAASIRAAVAQRLGQSR